MRYSQQQRFLFYVCDTKDDKRFLVCYNLKEEKEFGREKFNRVIDDSNYNYLN